MNIMVLFFLELLIIILLFNVIELCYIFLNVNVCIMYYKGDKMLIK